MAAFPGPEAALTCILVVSYIERSPTWYADMLGATVHREYGGSSIVLTFAGSWLPLLGAWVAR